MNLINKIINNPVFTLAWLAFVELLVREGYLLESQRSKWSMEGSTLILQAGLVILVSSYAHHKFDLHKKQKLADDAKPTEINITTEEVAKESIDLLKYIKLIKAALYAKPQQQQQS